MSNSPSSYTAVVGTVLALVGGLLTLAPDVPDWAVFAGGVVLATAGFVGVYLRAVRNNGNGRPEHPDRGDRDMRSVD